MEEGLDVVEEFYGGDIHRVATEQSALGLSTEVVVIKQGLQQSVKALCYIRVTNDIKKGRVVALIFSGWVLTLSSLRVTKPHL